MPSIALITNSEIWARELSTAVQQFQIRTERPACIGELSYSTNLVIVQAELLHGSSRQIELGRQRPPIVLVAAAGNYEAAVLALKVRAVDFWQETISAHSAAMRIGELLTDLIPSPHYLARKIDKFLKQNHSRPDLSTSSVAREFGVSPGYVSRLMNLDPWYGFRNRLMGYRIRHAEKLLIETDLPLYQISEDCGFRSPGRFSEAFSREAGVPPKRFRAGARPLSMRPLPEH
jgi:AraC-like DNA-binding protein